MGSSEQGSSLRYCANCGAPLEEDVKFCTNCGSPVSVHDLGMHDSGSPKEAPSDDGASSSEEVSADGDETARIPVADAVCVGRAAENTRRIPLVPEHPPVKLGDTAPMPVVPGPSPQETVQPNGQQAVSYLATDNPGKPRNTKKIAIIAACVVAGLALVGIVVFALLGGQDAQEPSASDAVVVDKTAKAPDQIVVELTETYRTGFAQENSITYPTFEFSYPSSWSVTYEDVFDDSEWVDLTGPDGAIVSFSMNLADGPGRPLVDFAQVEKVADASFVPVTIQASDYSDLGAFMVAKGMAESRSADSGGETGVTTYALLPVSALSSTSGLDLASLVPGFAYGGIISFGCFVDGEISAQTEQEIIAILASFKVSDAQVSATVKTSDYMLADSGSRYYSEDELRSMSDYDLYIARNEIFARYGRIFDNQDLRSYFESKAWYSPSIAPEDFDDSMLNKYEKANIEAISKIENERQSPYVK